MLTLSEVFFTLVSNQENISIAWQHVCKHEWENLISILFICNKNPAEYPQYTSFLWHDNSLEETVAVVGNNAKRTIVMYLNAYAIKFNVILKYARRNLRNNLTSHIDVYIYYYNTYFGLRLTDINRTRKEGPCAPCPGFWRKLTQICEARRCQLLAVISRSIYFLLSTFPKRYIRKFTVNCLCLCWFYIAGQVRL